MSDERRVGFVSLGCPKALVDSERILTQLKTDGYDVAADYEGADVVVVNTCGFIESAVTESLDAIGEAIDKNGKVIVTGCLGKDADKILSRYPQVMSVTGPQAYEEVVNAVHEVVAPPQHNAFIDLVPDQGIKLTPRHYAYLKISEGCNHKCTFCIIPSLRGKLMSRTIDSVLDEAQRLVNAGVKELLVISQDTSAYGSDIKYKTAFWQGKPLKTNLQVLCEELGKMGVWVRLHYVYPYPNVDNIIPLMASGHVLPYLDIPLQHASPRILKLMKRPAAVENTLSRIQQWRELCPDIVLRSTFIVGFPDETEEDFNILLDFLREARLDRVGCFKYSPVEGATANEIANAVPEEIQQERLDKFMAVQQAISSEKLQEKVGKVMPVIIDEVVEEGAVGRTYGDAPEIDGQVFLDRATYLKPGDVVEAKVEEADDYDVWAQPISPESI